MSRCWVTLIAAALLAACQSPAPIVIVPPPTPAPTTIPTPAPMRVYVSGAVARPGVYLLPPHSIGEAAIQAAGGATGEADLEGVNLAQELHDQEHFHVPHRNEAGAAPAPQGTPAAGVRININTATAQELDQLPKIGPVTAQQIIEFRSRNGPFQRVEDIMQVKGIGQATFDQIKDMITVGD